MNLLSGTNPHHLNLYWAVTDQRSRNIENASGRGFRNERLSASRGGQRAEDDVHGMIQAQKKPCHFFGGDGDRSAMPDLIVK